MREVPTRTISHERGAHPQYNEEGGSEGGREGGRKRSGRDGK